MEVNSKMRLMNIKMGGALVVIVEGYGEKTKAVTKPLGLSLWASKVNHGEP